MRRMIAGLGGVMLFGCGEAPDTSEQVMAGSPVMGPGSYAVGDGTTVYSRTRLEEDGRYFDLDEAGKIVGTGIWNGKGDTVCFDPAGDGEGLEERCWRNDPADPDGSFFSRRIGGMEHYRVTPLDE